MMRSALVIFIGALAPVVSLATPAELDALVNSVREDALRESRHDSGRVDRFLDARDSQRTLLDDAKKEFAQANVRADALRGAYEKNEKTLTEYQRNLENLAGDLNDLFAIVRQTSLNAHGIVENSLVSAERADRADFLLELGKAERPPSIEDIKRLWTSVLFEVSESGKVVQFDALVINPQGSEDLQSVTRVGVFNAVSEGAFLRYLPNSGKLVELSRQPPARFQRMARGLEAAQTGVHAMAVDPSRGAILSLLVQAPDIRERLRQGGIIGYVIIALGILGALLLIRRAISMLIARRRINAQIADEAINPRSPLGRLRQIADEKNTRNSDEITLRIDEQLAEESSRLHRGLATVAVLAAVSPLLGLLGTVTGMIETFQSITLFGTGDPKLMSGGISQALVTTQLGLAVAIPLVLFHSVLSGRANRLIEQLGKLSSDMLTGGEPDARP